MAPAKLIHCAARPASLPRSRLRQRVVDPAPPGHYLASRLQCPSALQRMQHWVDHSFADYDHGIRALADSLHDFITVHLRVLKQPQDQQLRHAIHEIRVRFPRRHYVVIIPRGSRYSKNVALNLSGPGSVPSRTAARARRYRPGIGSVLSQIAFGASERAATMSGQPSPLKSANANPYTVPLPSFQRTS